MYYQAWNKPKNLQVYRNFEIVESTEPDFFPKLDNQVYFQGQNVSDEMSYICNGYSSVLFVISRDYKFICAWYSHKEFTVSKSPKRVSFKEDYNYESQPMKSVSQSQNGEYNQGVRKWHTLNAMYCFSTFSQLCKLSYMCVWDECTLYDQECQIGWPLAHSAPLDE